MNSKSAILPLQVYLTADLMCVLPLWHNGMIMSMSNKIFSVAKIAKIVEL